MSLPKITIITVSYQQGNYLEQALRSVLDQRYPNLEYLVIDGGSTDRTVAILKKYGKQLSWVSEPDRGQSDAFNKGIQRATGDIIGFLNSDDRYLPGTLAAVAQQFVQHPEKQWLTGSYQIITAKGQPRDGLIITLKLCERWLMQRTPRLGLSILKINNPLIHPSTFIRRNGIQMVGGFNEKLRYCMDYDLWLRLWNQFGAPLFLQQALSQFRIHDTSKGGSQFRQQFAEQWTVAGQYHINLVERWLHRLITWLTLMVYGVTR